MNEPRRTRAGWRVLTPTWGTRPRTDIAAMYTAVGNLIHEVSPDVLIVCEGLGYAADWCWWALNPTQPRGTVPVTGRHRSDWGDPEPWGLLTPDWRGVANPAVLDLLKSMIPPRTGPGVSCR